MEFAIKYNEHTISSTFERGDHLSEGITWFSFSTSYRSSFTSAIFKNNEFFHQFSVSPHFFFIIVTNLFYEINYCKYMTVKQQLTGLNSLTNAEEREKCRGNIKTSMRSALLIKYCISMNESAYVRFHKRCQSKPTPLLFCLLIYAVILEQTQLGKVMTC